MDQSQTQIIVSVVLAYVLQFAKKTSWFPLLTERSDKIVKVAWSAIVAAGAAFAIGFSFDATLGQLTVTGLTWSNVGNGLLAFLLSFITQQATYRMMIEPKKDARG